jgi:hypothetical protein
VSDCFERSSSGFFSLVECRLIVYDHGLLLNSYINLFLIHTPCVFLKKEESWRERGKKRVRNPPQRAGILLVIC